MHWSQRCLEELPKLNHKGALPAHFLFFRVFATQPEKHQQALQFYQYSLATTEMLIGDDHPDLIPTLSNLASLHQMLGEQTQAEALYQRASAISEKRLGTKHPQTQLMHESYTSPLQMPSDSDKQDMWQRLLRRIGW